MPFFQKIVDAVPIIFQLSQAGLSKPRLCFTPPPIGVGALLDDVLSFRYGIVLLNKSPGILFWGGGGLKEIWVCCVSIFSECIVVNKIYRQVKET